MYTYTYTDFFLFIFFTCWYFFQDMFSFKDNKCRLLSTDLHEIRSDEKIIELEVHAKFRLVSSV